MDSRSSGLSDYVNSLSQQSASFAASIPAKSFSSPSTGNPVTDSTVTTGQQANSTSKGNISAPRPEPKEISRIKSTLLSPAQTSNFQCWFYLPETLTKGANGKPGGWLRSRNFTYNSEKISLNCSEASLPGSTLMTNEISDDYHGVTERHSYRRQYDDRADFTFYVDAPNYDVIWLFEQWIAYIANEQYGGGQTRSVFNNTYYYRFQYPIDYQSNIFIQKFEKKFGQGLYLEYRFMQAYPISINSIPVSYDSSQLLKCTVSFAYTRYIVERRANSFIGQSEGSDVAPKTAPGTPNIPGTSSTPGLSGSFTDPNSELSRAANAAIGEQQVDLF